MKPLRVGVIGCGGAGRNHAVGYSRVEGVQIVGLADVDRGRAETLGREMGAPAFSSFEAMITAARPDAVSVCTPEYHHVAPSLYALNQGCHVLCEKIMAPDLASGKQMVRRAADRGLKLGVNYNYRYIDSVLALQRLLAEESFGALRTVQFNVHAYCHHHALDLIRFLFGEFEQVTAVLTEDPAERHFAWNDADAMLYIPSINACTVIRIGQLVISLVASHRSFSYPLIECMVYGTAGRAKISDMRVSAMNGDLMIQHEDRIERTPMAPVSLDELFYRSIAGWVAALRGQTSLAATGDDGLRTMQIEAAISRSSSEGSAIQVSAVD